MKNEYYSVKVDSCRLSIPARNCEILNNDLLDDFEDIRINKATGETEIIKAHKGVPFQKNYTDGTYIKIWLDPQITYDKVKKCKGSELYLTVLVNSKHLQRDYFKGITKDTLEQLYTYIMSLEVFKTDFNSFSNARYTDVDLAFDFYCTLDHFAVLKENILRACLNPTYFHSTNTVDNCGIWTPTRRKPREQATPKRPYIKFYSKELDFLNKSRVFARKYFKYNDYKDVVRYECTIKNTAHKKRLGLKEFPTFLSFLQNDLQLLSQQIFNEYFKKVKFVVKSNIKPMDKVIIDLINECIQRGASQQKIRDMFNRYDVGAKARSRLVDKYHHLNSSGRIKKETLEANQTSHDVFTFLGVDLSQTKLDL